MKRTFKANRKNLQPRPVQVLSTLVIMTEMLPQKAQAGF